MHFSRSYASGLSATGQNKHWSLGGWGLLLASPFLNSLRECAWDLGSASEAEVCRDGKNESRLESALLKYHGCGQEALQALRHLRSFPVWSVHS